MAYSGSIDLISGLRPKNGGAFPLVNKEDVYVDDERRLGDVTDHFDKLADVLGIPDGDVPEVMREVRPTEYIKKHIWHVINKAWYVTGSEYAYAFFKVTPETTVYVTGSAHSNVTNYPVGAFYDADGAYIESFGTTASVVYTDEPVTVPEGAATMVVNKTVSSQTIKVQIKVRLTGSTLIDGVVEQVDSVSNRMDDFLDKYDAEHAATPGSALSPESTVEGSIYNVQTDSTYGDSSGYGHAFYTVEGGKKYFVTCASASNATSFPGGAFYTEAGTMLETFADDPQSTYTDYLITVPANAAKIVLNKNNGLSAVLAKIAIEPEAQGGTSVKYNLNTADALLREAKKNPFAFKPFTEGIVTFVFDDLLEDLDSIASIFEEYGYPIGIAAIPDKLDNRASYLTETRGNFTPGMSMRAIAAQVVENGGEVMTHSADVITEENQYDYETMYGHFVSGKATLTEAGFTVRGHIRAGGTGALNSSAEIERWLIGNYDYSNQGISTRYAQDRVTINAPIATIKQRIDTCKANKTWLKFMCHGYEFGGGETFTGEDDLREILDYIDEQGMTVMTYAGVFDEYGSSALALNGGGGGSDAKPYDLNMAEGLVREARKNPWKLGAMETGCISFVFDDLPANIDLICAIFAENDAPICLAAIPENFSETATGLTETRGGYTQNMTRLEVCQQAVALGGEVFTHNSPFVTLENQYDYDFMYNYFVAQKKRITDEGIPVRGLIRAGGSDAPGATYISRSEETEKWLAGNYEYSDMGLSPNYMLERVSIDDDFETVIKPKIDECATQKTWLRFMCHTFNGSGHPFADEADLQEILDYIAEKHLPIKTYADVFDNHGTTTLGSKASTTEDVVDTILGNFENIFGNQFFAILERNLSLSVDTTNERVQLSFNGTPIGDWVGVQLTAQTIPCEGISYAFEGRTFTLAVGDTKQIPVNVLPEECTQAHLWVANPSAPITVLGDTVTGFTPGKTSMYVKCGQFDTSSTPLSIEVYRKVTLTADYLSAGLNVWMQANDNEWSHSVNVAYATTGYPEYIGCKPYNVEHFTLQPWEKLRLVCKEDGFLNAFCIMQKFDETSPAYGADYGTGTDAWCYMLYNSSAKWLVNGLAWYNSETGSSTQYKGVEYINTTDRPMHFWFCVGTNTNFTALHGFKTEEAVEEFIENIDDNLECSILGATDEYDYSTAPTLVTPIEYLTASSYAIGDIARHEGVVYRCISATTGAWDEDAWEVRT